MISFLVCKFEKSTLSNLVKESFGSSFPDIMHKKQVQYIYHYLKDLGAKSVLLEREYIDRDYLEDYSRYYVKCFGNHGHKCARLHFFKKALTHKDVSNILSDETKKQTRNGLCSSYLGFIVVKPLPKTFIGRTCLKQYSRLNDNVSRRSLNREYPVDLFGISLSVKSIAFQEQDKVMSACATTSIWSALHALSWKNLRDIPACSQITANAINHIDGSSNSFPNKELTNKQIMRALDLERLRYHTESIEAFSADDFIVCVRNHIDSDIPLILGAHVYSVEKCGTSRNKRLTFEAGHAVTVLGYKQIEGRQAIYIHDDRLGPFVRATFSNVDRFDLSHLPEEQRNALRGKWGLVLQEKSERGQWLSPHEILVPCSLIIPTQHKVRLPAKLARNTCKLLIDSYIKRLESILSGREEQERRSIQEKYSRIVTYTLRLEEISRIRQDIIDTRFAKMKRDEINYLRAERAKFLARSYARFQWVARFYLENKPAFRILFDATDIPQGDVVSGIFLESRDPSEALLRVFRQMRHDPKATMANHFIASLIKFLKPIKEDYFAYLDRTFGEERAPLYLKEAEVRHGEVAEGKDISRFYEPVPDSLDNSFPDIDEDNPKSKRIWAIAHDGCLLVGREVGDLGHPTLTGFKPARIAGELSKKDGRWLINSKSGRYSSDYPNAEELLRNAKRKFSSIFPKSSDVVFTTDREGRVFD